jgi:hypothetical protein
METPYRKDCSQGLVHVHKYIFSIKNERFSTDIKLDAFQSLH